MALSLRQRILWWSLTSTLVILAVVFFVVDRSFGSTIRQGLEENVTAGALFAAELHRSQVADGVEQVVSLASAPTLRAAVETGDPATVSENLDAMLTGTRTEWLAVANADGQILATSGPAPAVRIEQADLIRAQARFYGTAADLWIDDRGLLEVAGGGIFFGSNVIGFIFLGERVDSARIESLELATGQDVAIIDSGRLLAGAGELGSGGRDALVASWQEAGTAAAAEADEVSDTGPSASVTPEIREIATDEGPILSAAVPLPGADGNPAAHLVAYRSLEEAMAPARQIRITFAGVALAGIVLAVVFSLILARGVTDPVQSLLKETKRLGSGDLEHPVEPERDDEIGRLAEGFETMRQSLLDAREELLRAERLSAVGRAASAIVHDFSQPVSVIQGNVELLEYDWDEPQAREEDVRVIRRELRRLDSMMQEILDFARGDDRIRRTSGSVRELLDDIARRFGPDTDRQDITLTVEHGYEGQWSLDFTRITRVIENLIRNAIGAVGEGGQIRLVTALDGDVLEIRVEDDGPGIPDDLAESLFEPFVTRGKERGTGLGLAIAKSFTERHGGSIRFSSSSEGTTFILRFPESDEEVA